MVIQRLILVFLVVSFTACSNHTQRAVCPYKNPSYCQVKKQNLMYYQNIQAASRHVKQKRKASARVLKSKLSKKDDSYGLWEGYIKGNGQTNLYLQITRNGLLESTRFMGKVALAHHEDPTSFHFKSLLPKGTDWEWQIITG